MPAPVPGSVGAEILDALAPMLYSDSDPPQNNALAIYISSLGDKLIQEIEDYVSDDPITGAIGYSVLVDINRTPDKVLPWLAQFVGATLTGGLSAANQRQQIRDLPNWRRGSVAAMRDAPKPYLTGAKTVIFRERFGGPGKLTVITYTGQTPDSSAVLAALLSQKPAGITLTYNVLDGQDLQSVYTNFATLNDLYNHYTTLNGVLLDQPGA